MKDNIFQTAFEALRERLYGLENHAVSLRDIEATLAETRAALAVFERWAAVPIGVIDEPETETNFAETTFTVLLDGQEGTAFVGKRDSGWFLDEGLTEAESIAGLAAAIECRRRNEAAGAVANV